MPEEHRAGGGPRDRLPFRRPDRRERDCPPERDERARAAPLAAVILVRARTAGFGAQGLGRRSGECRGRPEGVLPARKVQRGGAGGGGRRGGGGGEGSA